MYGFDGAGIDDMHVCPNCGQTGDITHQGGCVPQDEGHDLAWVEELTGLTVVEATESTFVLSDGTEHFLDANLIARLQRHGVVPPWPWPRIAPQDVRSLHCTVERVFPYGQRATGYDYEGVTSKAIECGQPAAIVVLSERQVWCEGEEHEEGILTAWPVCADHAPEEVHEIRCSMDESEFLVLDLPITKEN